MPNFDCGTYFLSTLIPVKTLLANPEKGAEASPVHRLRTALAETKPARQTPFCTENSPFAKSLRNHFARFVVIEDVAYVGRKPVDALFTVLTELLLPPRLHVNPVDPQPQDHLSNPFLFFSADFDARSGDDSERDAYLIELWNSAGPELARIFQHCERFEEVTDAESFARYVARCQLETTMPFHDYFMDDVPLKDHPDSLSPEEGRLPEISIWMYSAVFAATALAVYSLAQTIAASGSHLLWLLHVGLALVAGMVAVAFMAKQAGEKPFPPAQNATLPEVLKALYLRDQFTRFAIDNQMLAAEPADAQALQDRFRAFVRDHDPENVAAPTQAPGVIGVEA